MSAGRHQLLMRVLAEVIECDTGRRAVVLDASCRGDDSLRAEVERLLARKASAARFLEKPVAGAAAHAGLPAGERIGPYCVEREIGRGGMGVVYLAARNNDEFERRVAVKLVKRGMDAGWTQTSSSVASAPSARYSPTWIIPTSHASSTAARLMRACAGFNLCPARQQESCVRVAE
ncbi:MAG: hypothetical protein H0T60_01925 [Acidobacteria bacterium]|nr:hypothetical protein [Acidobacteriota bacterium]